MGLPKVQWWVTPCVLFSIGLALILCAIVVPFKIEEQIDDTLINQFLFEDDKGEAYERWTSNEPPDSALAWAEIYLYNTTNPDEVILYGEKPILKQVGPFYYQQFLRNINATFSNLPDGERVVTSTPYIYSIFNGTLSIADEETTMITMPGVGWWALAEAYVARSDPDLWNQVKQVLSILYYPYLTRSVHEWLFGFVDPVLTIVKQFNPILVGNDVVALFRNSSSPEDAVAQYNTSTVSCGYPNAARFQEMIEYQGNTTVKYWNPPSQVDGSPGNYFGFRLEGQDNDLKHFWGAISRMVMLNHTSTGTWNDIKFYRYRIDPKEYYNATLNPKNAQYWQTSINGAFNLTSEKNASIFATRGHFLGVDQYYHDCVVGLDEPNPLIDDTYMDIEPLTGACIVAYKPLQINQLVGNFVDATVPVNISNLFLHPLTFLQLHSQASTKQAAELRDALEFYDRAIVAEDVMLYFGSIVGAVFVIMAGWVTHHRREEQKDLYTQELHGEETDGQVPAQVDISYGAVGDGDRR